jgi:autophagy-related protein 9
MGRGAPLASHANVSYQSFTQLHTDENDVVINVVPSQTNGSRSWQHYINDLDFFFAKIYKYHRYAGFPAIAIRYTSQLLQFFFVICFTFFLAKCVNYNVLISSNERRTFADILLPFDRIQLTHFQVFLLTIAFVSLFMRTLKVIQKLFVYRAIGQFYADALRIRDCTLFTWPEVQARLIETERVCLFQGKRLTELDVHNRILRRKNYMIALVNKQLLPIHYRLPLLGELTYCPKGLLYYFNFIFFKAPFIRLFETSWKLKDEYKQIARREECAQTFRRNCFRMSILMVLFGIFFSFWQFLNLFYRYADEMKTNPGRIFSFRTWTPYAKLFCRHFNELDHHLEDRLNKGHRPATKYMNSFISVPLESLAKLVLFMSRAMAAVLGLLAVYSEHVLGVEHMVTVLAALFFVGFACNGFIRGDVPQKHTQVELYDHVLGHVHYVPVNHPAATPQARSQIALLFGYKIGAILEELLCPFIAPYIVFRHLSLRSSDLVDFFRNCSIEIPGIGDVCSFSMLNIDKNGNPTVRQAIEKVTRSEPIPSGAASANLHEVHQDPNQARFAAKPYIVSENGKLELSLIHFKSMNPTWQPYDSQAQFIRSFQHDLHNVNISRASGDLSMHSSGLLADLRSPDSSAIVTIHSRAPMAPSTAIAASLIPRTPYSSMIQDEEFGSGLQTPETNMSINSVFFRHRLTEIASNRESTTTENTTLLPQSVQLQTYTSSQIL